MRVYGTGITILWVQVVVLEYRYFVLVVWYGYILFNFKRVVLTFQFLFELWYMRSATLDSSCGTGIPLLWVQVVVLEYRYFGLVVWYGYILFNFKDVVLTFQFLFELWYWNTATLDSSCGTGIPYFGFKLWYWNTATLDSSCGNVNTYFGFSCGTRISLLWISVVCLVIFY